jgi:drug/metabolite transporter (DMT)-like permease
MNSELVQVGFTAGLFYSLQNTMEKIIFNKSEGNINDYFLFRLYVMVIIFSSIYFFYPSLLTIMTNTKMDVVKFAKDNYIYVFISAIFVLISIYFMGYGFNRFDISVFTPVYLISYLCFNIAVGILLFKEPITTNKVIGVSFAIASIILFNLDI